MDAGAIAAIVMGALSVFFGVRWVQTKILLKEVAEALKVTSDALQDDKLTAEEMKQLTLEWSDVIRAAKKLVGR